MSYMGVRLNHSGYDINVRLHGPFDDFPHSPKEIKDCVKVIIDGNLPKLNIVQLANTLAANMCDVFCNPDTIPWIQVDIESSVNGIQYGTSAEKV
jgi:hypothetical protein